MRDVAAHEPSGQATLLAGSGLLGDGRPGGPHRQRPASRLDERTDATRGGGEALEGTQGLEEPGRRRRRWLARCGRGYACRPASCTGAGTRAASSELRPGRRLLPACPSWHTCAPSTSLVVFLFLSVADKGRGRAQRCRSIARGQDTGSNINNKRWWVGHTKIRIKRKDKAENQG